MMTPQQSFVINNILVFLFQLGVLSLGLYLAHQALANIPIAQKFLHTGPGMLGLFLVNLSVCVLLIYWLVPMRILHALYLIKNPALFVWPDIIFSALILNRASYIWHWLFRYLERRSTS